MAKQITFEHNGIEYTLEFNRSTVRRMERNGFDIEKARRSPMSSVYELLEGALRMHHPNTDKRVVDAMFNKMGDLSEWGEDFIEMYNETFESLGNPEGEIKRTKNW